MKKIMLMVLGVALLSCPLLFSQGGGDSCQRCSSNGCFNIASGGYCVCDIENHGCAFTGICTIGPDGHNNCSSYPPGNSAGRCGKPAVATAPQLRQFPWLASQEFPAAIARLSGIEEAKLLLERVQKLAIRRGYDEHMGAQTAVPIADSHPAGIEDHVSRLVGVQVTFQEDGSHLFEFYVDQAGPGGETKYKDIFDMRQDKVSPVETVRVLGNKYTQVIGGVSYAGTF